MRNIFFALGTIIILALAWIFLPLHSLFQTGTITVTGTAQNAVANQIATFNATITSTNADKQTAVNDVNTKMTSLINSIKNLGIADSDIKTGSISVYQNPEILPMQGNSAPSGAQTQIYPMPPVRVGTGGWTASNSIEITVRDVNKSSGLADLLNNSGATNVYGPNLTVDNTSQGDTDLLSAAIADAKKKAQAIATASGESLGKVINVVEDNTGNIYPVYARAMMGGTNVPTPVQPGTTTLTKTVTVIFEIK